MREKVKLAGNCILENKVKKLITKAVKLIMFQGHLFSLPPFNVYVSILC